MPELPTQLLETLLTPDRLAALARAVVALLVGVVVIWATRRTVMSLGGKRVDAQHAMILRRFLTYTLGALTLMWVLRELGLNLGVLLGAAGVLTVAIGFASQTSVSNLISGVFLVGEGAFKIGDLIVVNGFMGFVESIDLLSIKMRTFENHYVRLPNETMIKTNVVNLTRWPIRRVDTMVRVAFKEDVGRVQDLLRELASDNPLILQEPEALFIHRGFAESAYEIQFCVWTRCENFLKVRNAVYETIKRRFDAAGIEVPYPHRRLYAGLATDPIPVRLAGPTAKQSPGIS